MRMLVLLILLGWSMVLNGEGKKPPPPPPPPPVSQENTDVFRASLPAFRPRFHPQLSYTSSEAQLYVNLFEGLTVSDPRTLRPEPGLAESWLVSEDQLVYRFTLKENLRFSNGEELTAQDFVDSWLNLLDPDRRFAFASLLAPIKGASAYLRGESETPPAFRADGPRTLVIELEQPSPQILSILGHHSLAPVPGDLLRVDDWSSLPPESIPCTGAYRVSSFQQDKVELVINPYYHNSAAPAFTKAEFVLSDDDEWLINAFNRGRLDWITNNVSLEQLEDGSALQVSPLFVTTFIYFRSDRPGWNDPRVRQALLMLLPLDALRQGRYADHTLVPNIPNYPKAKEAAKSSRSKAMALLEDAGFPGGEGLPEIVARVSNPLDVGKDTPFGIIKYAWEDAIGLKVSFLRSDNLSDQEGLKSDFDLGMLSWIGDYPDPMAFLQLWQSGSSLNFFGFQDPTFDSMVAQANTFSGEERLQKLLAAEEYLLDSAALLPLSHGPAVNLVNTNRIIGWSNNVLDSHPIRYLKRFRQLPSNSI